MNFEARLALYSLREPDTCWKWDGAVQPPQNKRARGGYGIVRWEGRAWYVHRLAYELAIGPIAPGMEIDHLCSNRLCFNPRHLEQVTRQENSRRGLRFHPRRRKPHCVHGHANRPDNVYTDRRGHHSCLACRRIASTRTAKIRRQLRAEAKAIKEAGSRKPPGI